MKRQMVAGLVALVIVPATAFASDIPTNTVPEPATWMLMGAGLIGVALVARRRKSK